MPRLLHDATFFHNQYDQSLKQSTETSITKSYYFDWCGGLAASTHNFRVSLLLTKLYDVVRCGLYVLPRVLSPIVYGVVQSTPAMVWPLSINMQTASTKYVIHPVQSTSWPSTAVISSKETLRFQGVERKVPPAASQAWLIKKGSSSHNVFFCMDLTTRNTRT